MDASESDKYYDTLNFVVNFLHAEGFVQAEELLLREIETRFPATSSGQTLSRPTVQHPQPTFAAAPLLDTTTEEHSQPAWDDNEAEGTALQGRTASSTDTAPASLDLQPLTEGVQSLSYTSVTGSGPSSVQRHPLLPNPALSASPSNARNSTGNSPPIRKRSSRQFASHMAGNSDVDDYDNPDDVGYIRKDISGQQRFVETELDISSEEGSEKYFMHPPGAAAGAHGRLGDAADGDGDSEGSAEERSDSSSISPSNRLSERPGSSLGAISSSSNVARRLNSAPLDVSSPSGSAQEVTLFARQNSSAADDVISPVLNATPGHARDETWDLGPMDIKFAEPVVTPSKSKAREDGESSKPVLSRVESLSSSFKDYDAERLSDYGEDRNILDTGDLSTSRSHMDNGDEPPDAEVIDFSLPSEAAVGLEDIEAARLTLHGLTLRSQASSMDAAAGSAAATSDRFDPTSAGSEQTGSMTCRLGSSLKPCASPASSTPGDTQLAAAGPFGVAGPWTAASAAPTVNSQRKHKPFPMQTDLENPDVKDNATPSGPGGGFGGGFSFPITPASEEPEARLFTSWPSVRSSTSEFHVAEDDEMAAEYEDDDYSRSKLSSRSTSMKAEAFRQHISETITLTPPQVPDTTLPSPLLPPGPTLPPHPIPPCQLVPSTNAIPPPSATAEARSVGVASAPMLGAPSLAKLEAIAAMETRPAAEQTTSAAHAAPEEEDAEALVEQPIEAEASVAPRQAIEVGVDPTGSLASNTSEAEGEEDEEEEALSSSIPSIGRGVEAEGLGQKAVPCIQPLAPGVVAHMINLSLDDLHEHDSDQFHSMVPSDDEAAPAEAEAESPSHEPDTLLEDGSGRPTQRGSTGASGSGGAGDPSVMADGGDGGGSSAELWGVRGEGVATSPPGPSNPSISSASGVTMPRYSVDEQGVLIYEYDRQYIERKYEIFNLRIIHRRQRTGFEESKDFPIRMNDLIAGRYQVMDFLGSAAFSRAVQALDIKTGTLVCLKIIKNNKDYFDQSLDEVKLLKFINDLDPHDEYGLVRLSDFFYYKEHLFLVCELLRANLYEFQKYNKDSGDEPYFTNSRIRRISKQVLRSLAFLHSLGLIHSDLKPENVLIKSYSRCEVKVIDLGSSCFMTDQLSSYVQSRSYRAPEVILGLPYDQKIDVWSLGCILAELSSGFVLFQNDSLATLLARLEGILGPLPEWMIRKGRYSNRFYTRRGFVYERSSTSERYELLLPKRTSLRHRVPEADEGLLDFISYLLTVDPLRRPSAAEALRHPWLSMED